MIQSRTRTPRTEPARRAPRFSERLRGYGLLLPAALLLTGIILVPELLALGMAFTDYEIGLEPTFVGFRNFTRVLTDPRFLHAFQVNVIYVVAAVAAQMILGVLLAVHMAKRFRFQGLWIALIMLPSALSTTVLIVVWRYILDLNIGVANYFISRLGFDPVYFLSQENALFTVILVEVWAAIPQVFLFIYPARSTISQDIYDSAAIDGASGFALFRHITLPLLKPAIYVALIFRTIFTIRSFGVVWLMTGGGPRRSTELLAIYLYKEGFVYNRFYSAAAVSFLILVITVLISGWLVRRMYLSTFAESTA